MQFSPLSFALGLAAASLVPLLSRVVRPVAVEATAAGLAVVDNARRLFAEQVETLEDIWAEARARYEHLDAEGLAVAAAASADEPEDDSADAGRARRRGNGGGRRRAS
jgi:hypothetical protein